MLAKYKTEIFFFLTLVAGIVILYPFVDYQAIMATGDHGRDLYAARVALEGHVPYRDYWWVYGPLMPYYYALFFKALGIHVPALLAGKMLLTLLSALLIFGALVAATVSPALSLIGALWFLTFFPDFFITYNHTGGIFLLLAVAYCLLRYLIEQRIFLLYLGLAGVFLLALVKVSFGLTTLFCLLAAAFTIDRVYKHPFDRQKQILFFSAAVIVPGVIFLIYWMLLKGLPVYAIRQCLPYLGDDQPYHVPLATGTLMLMQSILQNVGATLPNVLFAIMITGAGAQSIRILIDPRNEKHLRTHLLLAIGICVLFYVVNLQEFLVSGVFYRSLWAKPFAYLLMFIVLGVGTRRLPQGMRVGLYTILGLVLGLQMVNTQRYMSAVKVPSQYLGVERGKVFLGNEAPWIATVTQTVSYLETNLRKDELFFALPYDPLYYFLTDKISPTRQLIFFDHIKIPPEQEKAILADLEKNKVNWIVLTSRQHATKEYGLGILGKTYCPLIGEYIEKNFSTVVQFGDWINEPGWAGNHGTRILKRKQAP